MAQISIGQQVPDFSLPSTDGTFQLSNHYGKYVVLYFYPRDNTPGCTQEAKDFKDLLGEFSQANTKIYGISRDSLDSHKKFKAAQNLTFDLLSDTQQDVCKLFNVLDLDSSDNKDSCSMFRTTFLIDTTGKLVNEWHKVRVAGHAMEVLQWIKSHS